MTDIFLFIAFINCKRLKPKVYVCVWRGTNLLFPLVYLAVRNSVHKYFQMCADARGAALGELHKDPSSIMKTEVGKEL